MDVAELVRSHYAGGDLADAILAALAAARGESDGLTVQALAAVDQLHAGGADSTRYLFESIGLTADSRLLDVGSGIGGPARLAAAEFGCTVIGVDLSPDFVEAAETLTGRVGLGSSVRFRVGSGADTGLASASFERASMIHVGMNIPDKAAVFSEVRRLLVPGGVFGLYEQMQVGDGDVIYPLPWATDERSSFVASPDSYVRDLEAAGFVVTSQENRLASVVGAGGPPAGGLSPAAVFGQVFMERIANNLAAARAGVLAPVVLIAKAD